MNDQPASRGSRFQPLHDKPASPLTDTEIEQFSQLIIANWTMAEILTVQKREAVAALEHLRYARWLQSAPTTGEIEGTP